MFLFRDRHFKKRLERIWLSKRETKISLKHKKIEEIGNFAFQGNKNIEEIILPDTLKRIVFSAFCECFNLERIVFPNELKTIECYCFKRCKSLKEIDMPDSVTYLGFDAFEYCVKLEKVKLSNNIKEINEDTFHNCVSLKEIIIPDKVKEIKNRAFADCYELETVFLPNSLNYVSYNAFDNCDKISKVIIQDFKILLEENVKLRLNDELRYCYLNEETNELIVTSYKCNLDNYKEFILKRNYRKGETLNYKIIKEMIYDDSKIKNIRINCILNDFIKYNINKDNYNNVKENILNFDKFIKLLKSIDKTLYFTKGSYRISYSEYDLFKFAYALGAFSKDEIDRQRACEFIKVLYDKNLLKVEELHAIFESMKVKGFNKEFAEFIMKKGNIQKLMSYEKRRRGYVSRIYNSFNDIKEYGRRNRGNQSYRKVTLDMCVEYFERARFNGIDDENMDIAETIKKYTHSQETFEEAVKIREQFLDLEEENKINKHLLKEELKEIRKKIIEDTSCVLSNLNEESNNRFTYEYLSKYDPCNFVLGKYCSCCAHLEGVGFGIMKASILHPDCQNLVIRDELGNIIAKSTLYINRNQGYGLFNNIEINDNVPIEDNKLIYEKYIRAIEDFVSRYNELNVYNPIKQINVGMNLNDLRAIIRKNHKQSINILKGIDFSNYGGYEGDWQKEQYILWKKQ